MLGKAARRALTGRWSTCWSSTTSSRANRNFWKLNGAALRSLKCSWTGSARRTKTWGWTDSPARPHLHLPSTPSSHTLPMLQPPPTSTPIRATTAGPSRYPSRLQLHHPHLHPCHHGTGASMPHAHEARPKPVSWSQCHRAREGQRQGTRTTRRRYQFGKLSAETVSTGLRALLLHSWGSTVEKFPQPPCWLFRKLSIFKTVFKTVCWCVC